MNNLLNNGKTSGVTWHPSWQPKFCFDFRMSGVNYTWSKWISLCIWGIVKYYTHGKKN